jgi:hypothetical protein
MTNQDHQKDASLPYPLYLPYNTHRLLLLRILSHFHSKIKSLEIFNRTIIEFFQFSKISFFKTRAFLKSWPNMP